MRKVLVVDDEKEITRLLHSFLSNRQFDVLTAHNGTSALEIVKQQQPEMVFLDVCMPGMDGLTVLKHIREINTAIKVIMVTAFEDDETRRLAAKLGAVGFVAKPFSLTQLQQDFDL